MPATTTKTILAALLVLLVSTSGTAYTTVGETWGSNDIPVEYTLTSSIPSSWDSAIQSAAETWDTATDSSSTFGYTLDTTGNSANEISVGTLDGASGDKLAKTTIYNNWWDGTKDIDRATLVFDGEEPWFPGQTSDAYDVESVSAHEFGHALGLDHSSVYEATMDTGILKGEIWPRTLKLDDTNGLNYLY